MFRSSVASQTLKTNVGVFSLHWSLVVVLWVCAYKMQKNGPVFHKIFIAGHFGLRKINTEPHIFAHINIEFPNDRYPKLKIYLGRYERVQKVLTLPGINSRTVRPVADLYTDYPIPAHLFNEELCYEIVFGTTSESCSRNFPISMPYTAVQTPTVTHVQWWRGSGKESG